MAVIRNNVTHALACRDVDEAMNRWGRGQCIEAKDEAKACAYEVKA